MQCVAFRLTIQDGKVEDEISAVENARADIYLFSSVVYFQALNFHQPGIGYVQLIIGYYDISNEQKNQQTTIISKQNLINGQTL